MAKTISIEALSGEISRMLNSYVDEIADAVDDAADKVSSQCLKEIKAASPVRKKNGGTYKKGWKRKQTTTGRGKVGYTIYNERPGLPHLLEHGHAKVGKKGGRVAGIPHIAPAAEKAVNDFKRQAEEAVRNAGG